MYASKKQVQEKNYNIETAHPAEQPNWRTQRSAEKQMGDDMRWRSKLLLDQKTDFIHTFQPMEGCQSCLCFLASLLTLRNYSLAYFSQHTRWHHLFNITTSTAIHLDFSARPRGHEQPFPLLCSRASCCKSRYWLRSVAYETFIASLPGCSVGVHFLRWTQDSLLLDTDHSKNPKPVMKLQTKPRKRIKHLTRIT